MNKKGLSWVVKTLIIILLVLVAVVIISGVMNHLLNQQQPQFKITQEECWNVTFELKLSEVINGERTITVYDEGETKLINLAVEINLGEQCFNESAKECQGYYEVCEDVEVEEIKILQPMVLKLDSNKGCIAEKTEKGVLNIVNKNCLDIEWLDENCECSKRYGSYSFTGECLKDCSCEEYKCGSYTVEVKRLIDAYENEVIYAEW